MLFKVKRCYWIQIIKNSNNDKLTFVIKSGLRYDTCAWYCASENLTKDHAPVSEVLTFILLALRETFWLTMNLKFQINLIPRYFDHFDQYRWSIALSFRQGYKRMLFGRDWLFVFCDLCLEHVCSDKGSGVAPEIFSFPELSLWGKFTGFLLTNGD